MPKYSVDEVISIIQSLTIEEKQTLQAQLPALLSAEASPAAARTQQTQSFGNITMGNSNTFGVNQVTAEGSVDHSQHSITSANGQSNVQEILNQLQQLKQGVNDAENLNKIEKKNMKATLEVVEEELTKPEPDKDLIDQAINALSKGLEGIEKLAAPTMRVAKLVATALLI